MTIIEQSLIFHLLLSFRQRLDALWAQSSTRQICLRLGRWFQNKVRSSILCDFFWRDGVLVRQWRGSLSFALFTWLLNLPCAAARWLYRVGQKLWDGSFVFHCLSAMGGSAFLFLGLFLLVMLVAPHSLWNNAYGFLGAVAVTVLFILGSATRPQRRLDAAEFGPYMLFYLLCVFCALVSSLSTSLSMRFFLFHAAAFSVSATALMTLERVVSLLKCL